MIRKSLLCLFFSFLLIFGTFSSQYAQAEPTFSYKFGSSGSDDNELNFPTGIALSSSGNTLYVADTDNYRINAFSDDGDHLFEFGSFCNMETNQGCNDNADDAVVDGDGQFNEPIGVIVDASNDIYVVDSQNDRVQRFDSGGDFELKFGSSDNNDQDYLGTPNGIAIQESTGDIYISSISTDSIAVFDSSGTILFKFGSVGSDDGEFRNPTSIMIDDSEILYVADTDNDRIQMFELVDTNDNCPQGTQEIVNGICFVEEFGSSGTDNGEFNSPSGLAIDTSSDLLYVADTNNDRIQTFKLVDASSNCPQNTEEIVDGVCFVEKFGSSGSANGKFNSPSGLAIDTSNDLLYVADTNNNRIQVFTVSGVIQDAPSKPINVVASTASETSIILTWITPLDDEDVPPVTGYKIEYKTGTNAFSTIVADTKSPNTSFLHEGLETDETYTYRVYAINSVGTSIASSQTSAEPERTTVPSGLIATAISPSQIRLSWNPPSDTFNQAISGYTIQRVITTGVYDTIADVGSSTTTYTVNNLQTGKEYTYVVFAEYALGSSSISNEASTTPQEDSVDQPSSAPVTVPTTPRQLTATSDSNQIKLSWSAPSSDGNSPITGYKIEVKTGTSYSELVDNTKSTKTSHTHEKVSTGTEYTYRIFAVNSVGVSSASNEASATAKEITLEITSLPKLTTDEEKPVQFTVKVTGSSLEGLQFSLANNPPAGAQINVNTGQFTWTPTKSQGPSSYQFDIVARSGTFQDRESITITVNDVPEPTTQPTPTPEPTPEPKETGIASFVDPKQDPQYYINRYNNEETYKNWFDKNYPDITIYEAVGLENPEPPKEIAPFVDPKQDPQYYINRYNNEETYKNWFDKNHPDLTIYEAVGVEEPEFGICGPGTKLINGICELTKTSQGGGCLIATAAYGSEMAPQVQMLREIRDNSLLQTQSGQSFMQGFNEFYYSFSPAIADYERQNPVFKETVKLTITPLLASLSLLNYADLDSEESVLGYGIGIILMNIGMYFVAPAIVIVKTRKKFNF